MSGTSQKRTGVGAITVVLASVGGLVLVGTGATAAFAGASQLSRGDDSRTVDVSGVSSLAVDVKAADLVVRFDDVDEAVLETSGNRWDGWTFEVNSDELVVSSPNHEWNWFGVWWGGETSATLVLPEELAGSDADLQLQAGSLRAEGEFGDVAVTVDAGSLTVDGSATALDAEVNAGNAEITLDGVREASYALSAGWMESELSSVPQSTTIDVSAGSLTLLVPDVEYRLLRDVSAGSLESDLSEASNARNVIDATLSAGSIDLRAEG